MRLIYGCGLYTDVYGINKHLRPISLTPAMSKVAEDFVVRSHVGPAVLKQIDPDQYGGIPNSSTLHALYGPPLDGSY